MAEWLTLYDAALEIIEEAERLAGSPLDRAIGGTMLRHRLPLGRDVVRYRPVRTATARA